MKSNNVSIWRTNGEKLSYNPWHRHGKTRFVVWLLFENFDVVVFDVSNFHLHCIRLLPFLFSFLFKPAQNDKGNNASRGVKMWQRHLTMLSFTGINVLTWPTLFGPIYWMKVLHSLAWYILVAFARSFKYIKRYFI